MKDGTKYRPKKTGQGLMPGDPSKEELVNAMIRVNHAGEQGAVRIYEGQLAVLSGTGAEVPIREMVEQEQRHLDGFDTLLADRKVRPTLLSPIWHVAGFALGAGTALLGPDAAMACTQAVEEVIGEHYAEQANQLGDDESKLRDMIEDYRADEIAHRDKAVVEGAEDAPGYELLTSAVKAGSRLAIWLSTRA